MYETTDLSTCGPYPMDWVSMFTPIELVTWGEIRGYGLPFWPQYPIGPFFADFADPVTKIVIECDGAAFHQDKASDARRDSYMAARGWSVFRISGADCSRVLSRPGEIFENYGYDWQDDKRSIDALRRWYLQTVDGLISAIAVRYYFITAEHGSAELSGLLTDDIIEEVLSNRRTA